MVCRKLAKAVQRVVVVVPQLQWKSTNVTCALHSNQSGSWGGSGCDSSNYMVDLAILGLRITESARLARGYTRIF